MKLTLIRLFHHPLSKYLIFKIIFCIYVIYQIKKGLGLALDIEYLENEKSFLDEINLAKKWKIAGPSFKGYLHKKRITSANVVFEGQLKKFCLFYEKFMFHF